MPLKKDCKSSTMATATDDECVGCCSKNLIHSNVTVKFQISETHTVAQVYSNCKTIGDIKKDIGEKFEIDPKYLILSQCGKALDDLCELNEMCKNEYGIVHFHLDVDENIPLGPNGQKQQLNIQTYHKKFRLADFLTVHVTGCKCSFDCDCSYEKDVVVEIHNFSIVKPFLGGYRDPKNCLEYHDAFSQTGPAIDNFRFDGIISEGTQTISYRTKHIDTMHDAAVQSFGDSTKLIHISSVADVIVTPTKYKTYLQTRQERKFLGKVILIQKNFRRYLIVRYMKRAAAEYRRLVAEQNRREVKRMDNMVDYYQKEAITKVFPKQKEDFDVLLAEVQRWKVEEVNRINKMYSGGPRIAELCLLLEKEVQMLNGIEQQRNDVRKFIAAERENKLLNKMGETIKWIGYKDMVVEMDLIRTQKVRYLKSIYDGLKKKVSRSKRLELLDNARCALEKEELTPEIAELFDLIEREKNMIILTNGCNTTSLRTRQNVLFAEIIKQFHVKDKKDDDSKNKMCDTCKEIKPLRNFALLTRQINVDTCQRCYDLKENIPDHTIFRSILRSIQREERRFKTLTSYAFILQEADIRYIVVQIWHGHSILGKKCDLPDLRLPRWIKSEDWSPWNCVCLSVVESRNHERIKNLEDIYDEYIMQDIKNKHLLAKTTFRRLQTVETDFVESGHWWKVGVADKIV